MIRSSHKIDFTVALGMNPYSLSPRPQPKWAQVCESFAEGRLSEAAACLRVVTRFGLRQGYGLIDNKRCFGMSLAPWCRTKHYGNVRTRPALNHENRAG